MDECFPEAIFVLQTRLVDDWIAERMTTQNGAYAQQHAIHLGVDVSELNQTWRADWERHIASCQAYFGDRSTFVMIDVDQVGDDEYRDIFGSWFDLTVLPKQSRQTTMQGTPAFLRQLSALLYSSAENAAPDARATDLAVRRLANFAMPRQVLLSSAGYEACSNLFASLDLTAGTLHDRAGRMLPVRRDEAGRYLSDKRGDKFPRTVGVVNDLARVGVHGKYLLDFQDSCRVGVTAESRVGGPILAFCRRTGAENVVLWPLPGYQTVGIGQFSSIRVSGDIAFEDKADLVCRRGALSGHCSNTAAGEFAQPVHQLVQRIATSKRTRWIAQGGISQLSLNVRFAFVDKYWDHPDFDVRLTPNDVGGSALNRIGKGHLIGEYAAAHFFYQFRYLLCLRGFDTASNFVFAANSNSVVFKEEDGWEQFYTCLFEPWVHYIPLAAGAIDIPDKLAWARAHQAECKEMSRRARQACSLLSDRNIRQRQLSAVATSYQRMFHADG